MKIKNLKTEIDQNQKDVKQVFVKFRKLIEEKDKIILEIKTKLQRTQERIHSAKNITRNIKERHKTVKKKKWWKEGVQKIIRENVITIEDNKDNPIYVTGISEGEKNRTEIIFKPIIQENFLEIKD